MEIIVNNRFSRLFFLVLIAYAFIFENFMGIFVFISLFIAAHGIIRGVIIEDLYHSDFSK
ncbi:MAG: hypothetical protein ACJA1N_001814 [Saprospiraceae bacterium]|jgi:hypothetical protein|tara:strand:- start:154 stop:333 length:180 start_codon:yes stop_codon:yes gene_type:complete